MKKEIVERLKENWKPYGRLSEEEQEVLCEVSDLRVLNYDLMFVPIVGCGKVIGAVYRIAPDYQLPEPMIDPPKGCRIVSMEDRKRCKYPDDCTVLWKFTKYMDGFMPSINSLRWDDESSAGVEFAVPSDYVFAEDRPKQVLVPKNEEFEVFEVEEGTYGDYEVFLEPDYTIDLCKAIYKKAFAGMQFAGQRNQKEWHASMKFIDKDGYIRTTSNHEGLKMAVPVRVRMRRVK